MNQIEKVREETNKYFDPKLLVKDSHERFDAPSTNFRIETSNYCQDKDDVNWDVTKVEVYDNKSNEKIFDFFGNDGHFFHGWLQKDATEYLICAEDLFGGQTVVDLTNRKLESYSLDEDGFIWTNFSLSPDGKTLATIGCVWACPFVLKLYDFENPMDLPLKEIKEIELLGADETMDGWLDEHTLQLKGVKRKTEREEVEGGGFRMKVLSETPAARRINIKDFE